MIFLFFIYYLYYPIFWILKWLNPAKKFTAPTSRLKDIIQPKKEEWEYDQLDANQVLTFSGSSASDGIIFIQIVRLAENVCWSKIYVSENGVNYSGEFEGRCEEGSRKIICGPLLVDMRIPFRRWRVNFRGHLMSTSNFEKTFLSISGWWKPLTNARFFYSNTSLQSFSKIIEKSKYNFFNNLKTIENYRRSKVFHQMGELHLELRIAKDQIIENRYRGLREKTSLDEITTSTQISSYLNDGTSFTYLSSSEIDHGIFFKSDHRVFSTNLQNIKSLNESNMLPIVFTFSSELPFEIRKNVDLAGKFDYKRPDNKMINITLIKINSGLSRGFAFVTRTSETLQPYPDIKLESFPEYHASELERNTLVLPFAHRACQDKAITNEYYVPVGIVVSTTAFDKHVQLNPKIREVIQKLDESSNDAIEIGISLEKLFIESEISEELKSKILELLPPAEFYAVRSSAVGEDGADLSSAGQLESYLDTVKEDIFKKLKLCWASNFRREVLNYRRNHGQQLNPSMAVVIQEMNRNGVAGVLFTANPVKIDRSDMVINALKGSGELIVSGIETPDEIHFDRLNNQITTSSENCCLSDNEIRQLCKVGEYLERVFGRAQDIEFVYQDGKVNIVQSRDITGLDKETNFEMYYELDTPTFTDKEILSNGNVGEVFPAPLTAMESDHMCILFDKILMSLSIEDLNDRNSCHITTAFALHHHKVFMNFGEMMLRTWEACKNDRIIEIVVAGERLFDEKMFEQSAQRFGKAPKTLDIRRLLNMLYIVFVSSYKSLDIMKEASKRCAELIPSSNCTVEQAIKSYEKQIDPWFDATMNHAKLSSFSSFTYVISGMLIRGSEKGDLNEDNISDFANVFSNNSRTDVISADVPNSLKKLAAAIKSDNLENEFLGETESNDALRIMRKGRENIGAIGEELYLDAKSWAENTDLLVHTIKSMLTCGETVQKNIENEDDIINNLKCKPQGLRRTMLKYFIGQTHRGVAFRETSKNHLVSSVHSVRQTCRIIGQKLFEKGYLPEPNLWAHLTMDEIKELNLTRKPELVTRAKRRQQIAGKFEGLQFPLITHGHMNPIKEDEIIDRTASLSLTGTTVCEGKVTARARVAKTLEEATETLPGRDSHHSIHRHHGIVTEIGGLLSHGAVVAREYGLPSLIAVRNATQHFKTGDLVELDSIKGVIIRLQE
ncbi:unnamed protein product [Caenorhabditis angaria]|uniref:Phosphoenolpyruvate synthase n=1 Tax=Caenorhabditis angaria TaxID=860376 RepID=A0A9P1N9J2_9PELO|nr:unnamed protein product [Caenorhabditis angaria]